MCLLFIDDVLGFLFAIVVMIAAFSPIAVLGYLYNFIQMLWVRYSQKGKEYYIQKGKRRLSKLENKIQGIKIKMRLKEEQIRPRILEQASSMHLQTADAKNYADDVVEKKTAKEQDQIWKLNSKKYALVNKLIMGYCLLHNFYKDRRDNLLLDSSNIKGEKIQYYTKLIEGQIASMDALASQYKSNKKIHKPIAYIGLYHENKGFKRTTAYEEDELVSIFPGYYDSFNMKKPAPLTFVFPRSPLKWLLIWSVPAMIYYGFVLLSVMGW